jgi:flagellar motor switch protein FliM
MTQDKNKETLSQEEIDALVSAPTTEYGEDTSANPVMEQQAAKEASGEMPSTSGSTSQDDKDNVKATLSQEEIDASIASVNANGEKERQEEETLRQQPADAQPAKSDDRPLPPNDDLTVSQSDIDTLIREKQDSGPPVPEAEKEESAAVSQDDIDALITSQQESNSNANDFSGELSQKEIDDLLSGQRDAEPVNSDDNMLHQTDEASIGGKNDAWLELNQDILSKEEINALLSGFEENKPDSGHQMGGSQCLGSEGEAVAPKDHVARLVEKEENFFQKKKSARDLLKDLIQVEKKRIRKLEARKAKMVNDDLYRRFEINRADRTKIVVSMSEKNANRYTSSRPGVCTHRI